MCILNFKSCEFPTAKFSNILLLQSIIIKLSVLCFSCQERPRRALSQLSPHALRETHQEEAKKPFPADHAVAATLGNLPRAHPVGPWKYAPGILKQSETRNVPKPQIQSKWQTTKNCDNLHPCSDQCEVRQQAFCNYVILVFFSEL